MELPTTLLHTPLRPSAVSVPIAVLRHTSGGIRGLEGDDGGEKLRECIASIVVPNVTTGVDMVISFATSIGGIEAFLMAAWAPAWVSHRGEVRAGGGHSLTWDASTTCLVRRVPTFGKKILSLSLSGCPTSKESNAVHVTLLWATSCLSIVTQAGVLTTNPTTMTTEWAACGPTHWRYLPVVTGVPLWQSMFGGVDTGVGIECRLSRDPQHYGDCSVVVVLTSLATGGGSLLLGGTHTMNSGASCWRIKTLTPNTRVVHISGVFCSPLAVVVQRQQFEDEADSVTKYVTYTWNRAESNTSDWTLAAAKLRHDVVLSSDNGAQILSVSEAGVTQLHDIGVAVADSVVFRDGTRSVVVLLPTSSCSMDGVFMTAELPSLCCATGRAPVAGHSPLSHDFNEVPCQFRTLTNNPLQPLMSQRRVPRRTVVAAAHHLSAAAALSAVVIVEWE